MLMKGAFGCAVALCLAGPAVAQTVMVAQPVLERNVSESMARLIIDGALEQCAKDGYRVVVAVVDRAGLLKGLMAHDGVHPHNPELAQRKAFTARTFRQTSGEFQVRTEKPESSGLRNLDRVVWTAGGVPIKIGDETIGGVGVSGAPGGPRDEACAMAGLAKAAGQLR
jgi:uncharacterized protein GlcG (DUF336 family)